MSAEHQADQTAVAEQDRDGFPVITIDEEFHALIPPPSPEELALLEASIVAEGCRDALVVWQGVIVDGHNRYAICTKLGIKYEVLSRNFADRDTARDWMITNQLGRRNLNRDQFTVLLGERYAAQKKAHGGARASGQSDHLKTAAAIAKQHRVSEKTVRRAARTVKSLPKAKIADVIGGKTTLLRAKREQKDVARQTRPKHHSQMIVQANALVESGTKFATIVIDPPWGGCSEDGVARTAAPADLADLPVADLSAAASHLYLWVPNRHLPQGLALLKQWGFRYVTCVSWVVPSREAGGQFCGFTEQVFVAVRGAQPFEWGNRGTAIYAPTDPGGQGNRPKRFYDVVESCSAGPHLTMFDGRPRDRWTPWMPEMESAQQSSSEA